MHIKLPLICTFSMTFPNSPKMWSLYSDNGAVQMPCWMSPRNIAWTLQKLSGFLWSLEKQKGRNKGHGLFVCLSKNNGNNPQHLAQMCAYACIKCAIFMVVWHVTTQNFKIKNGIIQRDKRCGNTKCSCVKCRICLQRILFMTDLIHVQWKSKNEWVPDFWNERTENLRNKEKWHERQNVSNWNKGLAHL